MMGSQWWSIVGMKYAMSFASAVASELFDSKDQFQATLVGVMSDVHGVHPRDFFQPLVILSIPDKADVFKRWLCEMHKEERRIYGPAYSFRSSKRRVQTALQGWKLGLRLWSKAWELTHDDTYSLSISDREHVDLQVWMEWIGSNRSEFDKEMLEADAVGAEVTGSLEELIVQHDLLGALYLELEVKDHNLRDVLRRLNLSMDGHELGPKLREVLEAPLSAQPENESPGEWTHLHEAMFLTPYGRVWRLVLSTQPMINLDARRGFSWDTSLMTRAIDDGDAEAVAVLVESRVRMEVDHIHDALGSEEKLTLILSHPKCADLMNGPDASGHSPLMRACANNLPESVAALIAAGADSSWQDVDGITCWHYAASNGSLEALRALMANGNRAGLDVTDAQGNTPLMSACQGGHLDVVRFLLQQGHSQAIDVPSKDGWTPLNSASSNGHLEVVRLLLSEGRSRAVDIPNNYGWTPLNLASDKGHLEVVRFLLQQGHSQAIDVPSKAGWTPLNSACDSGHLEVGRFLLEEGQSQAVDIPNNEGATPLWSAVVGGHEEIAALLAPLSGSNAETTVEAGKLFHCAKSGTVDGLQSLLQMPAYQDVDSVQFPNGSTAVMFAAMAGRGDLMTALLDAGSNVNHVGRRGTALHCAAMEGHVHVVSQLLAAGADPSLLDKDFKTALQVASTDEVKALLRDVTPGGGEDEK